MRSYLTCTLASIGIAMAAGPSALLAQRASGAVAPRPILPDLYEVTPFHSQIEFAVPFMGLATVKGSFEDFSGALLLDEGRLENSSVVIVLQAASIHTGNAQRDKHLRSDDFLDVEKYPTLLFESARVEARADGGYTLRGALTIHGVSRPVVIPFTVRHAVLHDASGVDYAGFDATLKIDWRDFGIQATNKNNSWFQPARMLVNDSATITLAIQATRRHPSKLSYPALDQGMTLLAASGVDGVLRRYNTLKSLGADSVGRFARPLADMGVALIERGEVKEGLAILKLNVDAHPNDADAVALLAYGFLMSGDRASAMSTYRSAIAIDPRQPQALAALRRLE